MKNIITICGPTGIGKTGFAIYLAKQFNGEIIGADSMQIYKYMDIGTAKPDTSERAEACHHLVDFLDPAKEFDAGQYAKMADEAIDIITHKKRLPIVAGGTGLYIRAILYGLFRSRPVCRATLAELSETLEKKAVLIFTSSWSAVIRLLHRGSIPMTDSASSGLWKYF